MHLKKVSIKVLSGLGLFLALNFFCHSQTAGFSLDKITHKAPMEQPWTLSEEAKRWNEAGEKEAVRIFDQPFFFLGKGRTAYAFVSQDGQYVLKFVRYNHLRSPIWVKCLPSFFQHYKEKTAVGLKEKLKRNFAGHILGFEKLPQETQLIYLHLNKTAHLNKRLVIFDKIGIRHEVDLDGLEFMVQRKVGLICEELSRFMKNGHFEMAKESLDHLLQMMVSRQRQGIFDRDPNVHFNYGLVGTNPVLIDTGGLLLYKDHFVLRPNDSRSGRMEIYQKTEKLRRWLFREHPELGHYLEDKIASAPDIEVR